MSERLFSGGCLCGAIRFELRGALGRAGYCHCTRCQRRTGTAASANVAADGAQLRILSGSEQLKAWRHPDGGWEKLFCGACGGHVLSRNPDDHAQVGIRLGAFDEDPGVRPVYRQFVADAAPWEPIPDDGLRRYDGSGRASESARRD
jgi:hypothetical protein